MRETKRNRSRALAGARRNPSRDSIKDLEPIISQKKKRRHRIRIRKTDGNQILLAVLLVIGIYFAAFGMHCLLGL